MTGRSVRCGCDRRESKWVGLKEQVIWSGMGEEYVGKTAERFVKMMSARKREKVTDFKYVNRRVPVCV